MPLIHTYKLRASVANEDKLAEHLTELGRKIRRLAGCLGVSLYQASGGGPNFLFVERWLDDEARRAGSVRLGKEVFTGVLTLLDGPPASMSFDERAAM